MKRLSSLPMQISTRYLQLWHCAGIGKLFRLLGFLKLPQHICTDILLKVFIDHFAYKAYIPTKNREHKKSDTSRLGFSEQMTSMFLKTIITVII